MTKTAVYIRWSTEDQGEGTTLQVQRESCLGYCQQQEWDVYDLYIDEGYSGGNLYRPALEKLRGDVSAGRIDVVLVYRLDRLSRNVADASALVDREWRNRVAVRSATEDVKPEADEGWLNFTFRAAFAEYERRVIRQRTHAGKVRRAQEGRHVMTPPYGYRRGQVKGTLEVVPEQAAVVQRFFEKCVYENLGTNALAKWANQMGFTPPRCARWAGGNLLRLLQNPLYAGRLVFGATKNLKQSKEEAGPWKSSRAPLVDIEAGEEVIPRIISRELWDKAQEVLANRRTLVRQMTPRGSSSPHLLTGLIYCTCGSRMKVKPHGNGQEYLYYRCRSTVEIEPCPHQAGHVPADLVESAVVNLFLKRTSAEDIAERIEEHWRRQATVDTLDFQQKLAGLLERQAKLGRRLDHLDRQYLDQEITAFEMRRLRKMVEEELEEVRAATRETEAQLGFASVQLQKRDEMLRSLHQAREWHKMEDAERKRYVLSQFIRRVVALRKRGAREVHVTIEWTVADDLEQATLPTQAPGRTKSG